MSDALARVEWSSEQKDLIKKTVATDATDAELLMFLHIASKAGLDPLQKQIHFTKRQGRVTVIAGIDGLRARASREKDFRGIISGVVCQKDDFEFNATTGKVVKHSFNAFGDRGAIKGAWATVEREGMLPFTALVRFEEFSQPQSPTWKQMPSVMILKVAQSTALRQAYPEQFGGIYDRAELDQAGVADGEKNVAPTKGAEAVRAALLQKHETPKAALIVDVKDGETEEAAAKRAAPQDPRPFEKLTDAKLSARLDELKVWLEKANPKNKYFAKTHNDIAELEAEMALRAQAEREPGEDTAPPIPGSDSYTPNGAMP